MIDLEAVKNQKRPDFDGYTCDDAWESGRSFIPALLSEVQALRERVKELESRCEYIRSAYCDSLDVAKEFADKALAPREAKEK